MADVEVRGVRLHVQRLAAAAGDGARSPVAAGRDGGRGPAVVFVHGVLGNMSAFYYTLANHVAAAGHEVVLYDLRGHGLSECTPSGYRMEDMVADLEALVETVEPDRPVHVVGYSLGGTIAQRLTVARPELVASLILLEGLVGPESAHSRELWERGRMVSDEDAVNKLADAVIEKTLSQGRRRAAKTRRLLTETTFHADVFGLRSTEAETAPRISRPTLVLSAEGSEFFDGATKTAGLIAGATRRVIRGADHDTVLTEGAPAVRREVIAWLEEYPLRSVDERGGEPSCHASFSSSPH
jgi:pimeloyl-ACP methyl ester carboxylesterase